MKILKALIYTKDDIPPLLDGSIKRRVNIDVLRMKNVQLLVSRLDISHDEHSILEQIYNESKLYATSLDSQYEVVWIPIVDHTHNDSMQSQFEALQVMVPWYSMHHPSVIKKVVIMFIKERWHFKNKPILVVLDPQGKVLYPNALHMMKFTNTARAVALAACIPLEMVYVGKSSKRDKVQRVIATIIAKKLSYVYKIDEYDLTMQEIKKLLSYGKKGGWAMLNKGFNIVVNCHNTIVLPTMLEYDVWKKHIPAKGFDLSFKEHHDKLHGVAHPCDYFEFPSTASRISKQLKCPECQHSMEKYITFLCRHEEGLKRYHIKHIATTTFNSLLHSITAK
ncbi:hypothetical protein P3X46_026331 [Hevea brasiliensis]|uniref:Sieve element occlusion C-terminal domain-containing protein n=1 Tax=Hevea brasiliensis TaxID=3981 RepID=A0ABQ9KXP6_HEVBR|nr:hypothetical protein P3X46_026331 [Hevea brasiliensis]